MSRRIRLPFKTLQIPINTWALIQLWGVINTIRSKLAPPHHFRVTIWGSKRPKPDSAIYQAVFLLCKRLAELGIDILTGGGPGIMEAANAGAKAGGKGQSLGLRIKLRGEPANEYLDKIFHHETFPCRLDAFTWMSRVFIALHPGVGTLLEVIYVWQLMKEGHLKGAVLILVGEEWRGLLDWMDNGMAPHENKRSQELGNFYHLQTLEEAEPIVLAAYEKYKIMRCAA
ncbi:LOG family protein [Candidatus Parcubacteria bacterium]|nr:MAG: LOG family protein [Candidatus Parcubacteria bacterium]